MADLETLTLQINTESSKATSAIDELAQKLNGLSVSIAKLETGKLNDLALGLDNLNFVIKNMNATSSKWDYRRIVNNIISLSAIDTARLNDLSASVNYLAKTLINFSSVVQVSDNVKTLVSSISKLGGVGVSRAITNIPSLQNALTNLITSFSTLPEINQSVIDFTNSLGNLASQGTKIGTATNSINNSLERFGASATRASRKSFNLASAIGKVYAQFWILQRAASGLKKSFMDTADYLEAYNYFDVVAGKIGADTFAKAGVGSADDYAEAFTSEMRRKLKQMSGLELDLEDRLIKTTNAKSLGLNITEITQYQAAIASITNAMGQAQEVSTATAKAFSMLAADMGSLRNIDYEQVSQNLQSALTGQARALYKYGIDLTEATLEQYAYANGVNKAVSEMSQAEKAQLRLLAILDQSKVAWGDLANTINSPANQLRQLKTNLAELGTVFGQLFIPILQRTLPWVNGLSIALKQLLIDIASLLGIELTLDEFGQGFSDTIDEDTEAIDGLNKAMKETKKGVREFDELKVIGGDKSKAGSGLSDQIDLTKQILDATSEYERVWDEAYRRMESKAQTIAEALNGALDPIRDIVKDFSIGDFFKAGEDTSKLIASIFDFVTEAIADVDWNAIGIKIGEFFAGIDWDAVFASIGNLIGTAIQAGINLWTGAFSVAPFETALITAFALLKFTGLGDVIKDQLGSVISKQLKSTKIDFAKFGLGAISVGLGLSLTVDNIKEAKSGHANPNWAIKSAVSAAFTGTGLGIAASAIGFGAAGLTLGVVGALLTLAINIGVMAANMQTPYESAMVVLEEEYAWVTEYNLEAMEIKTNIELKGAITQDSLDNIDDLSKKVWDLSQNYNTLSDEQKGMLRRYSDELVEKVPGIKSQIDEITGAWKGTGDELQRIIDLTKENMRLNAYKENLQLVSDKIAQLETGKYSNEKELQDTINDRNAILQDFIDEWGKEKGTEYYNKVLEDIAKGVNPEINTDFQGAAIGFTLGEGKKGTQALIEELSTSVAKENVLREKIKETGDVIEDLYNDYVYWDGKINDEYTELQKQLIENTEDGIDKSKAKVDKKELPKSVQRMFIDINSNIQSGGKIAESDMDSLFKYINASFNGLGVGDVPKEMQATITAIKAAIINGSPELINLMGTLKQQMEEAFVNAHYDNNGNVIWNANNISGRLDKDVANIEEALDQKAKPGLTQFREDIEELFGEEIPETVDSAFKDLADTINSGKGTQEVMKSLKYLENVMTIEASKLGMNLMFGGVEGIYNGTPALTKAVTNGMVTPTISTAKDGLKENSPSKVFRDIGKYIPEGLALGIEDGESYSIKAIKNVVSGLQLAFTGYKYNVPSLDIGSHNRNQYYSNDSRYGNAATSLYDAMSRAYGQMGNGQTEVVFRVEGDPYGLFKVVREENNSYRNRTGRSAF